MVKGATGPIPFLSYVLRFYVEKLQHLIPHPKIRAHFFRAMGADIGRAVRIEDVRLETQAGWGFNKLKVGDYTAIASVACLDLTDRIEIGSRCAIGSTIWTHQDPGALLFESPTTQLFPRREAPVIIGDNVWMAAHSVVLCGVKIGEGAVVAAGSLVTGDVPSKTLVGGVPARVLKHLD